MGIKAQYRFPTRDYVDALRYFGLDEKFISPYQLPNNRSAFKLLLKRRMDEIYREDVEEAMLKGIWLLSTITDFDRDLRQTKSYKGLIANLGRLLGTNEPSSKDLKPIARLLFGNLRLCWDDADSRDAAGITDEDISISWRARHRAAKPHECRLCKATKNDYSLHLIYDCPKLDMLRPPSLAQGLSRDMTPTDMATWVEAVTNMQAKIEG